MNLCKGAPHSLASNQTPIVIRQGRKERKEGRAVITDFLNPCSAIESAMAMDKLLYLFEEIC